MHSWGKCSALFATNEAFMTPPSNSNREEYVEGKSPLDVPKPHTFHKMRKFIGFDKEETMNPKDSDILFNIFIGFWTLPPAVDHVF